LLATLIEEIKESPMKIQILEKWEKNALTCLKNDSKEIWGCVIKLSIYYDKYNICYCDIGSGPMCWEHYSLLLQPTRKKGKLLYVQTL